MHIVDKIKTINQLRNHPENLVCIPDTGRTHHLVMESNTISPIKYTPPMYARVPNGGTMIMGLRNRHTGYTTCTVNKLIQHLYDNYGVITPEELQENDRKCVRHAIQVEQSKCYMSRLKMQRNMPKQGKNHTTMCNSYQELNS